MGWSLFSRIRRLSRAGGRSRQVFVAISAALVSTFVAIYLVLLVLWASRALERRYFPLTHVSLASQAIAISSQALGVLMFAGITYATQTLASDSIIRRREYN